MSDFSKRARSRCKVEVAGGYRLFALSTAECLAAARSKLERRGWKVQEQGDSAAKWLGVEFEAGAAESGKRRKADKKIENAALQDAAKEVQALRLVVGSTEVSIAAGGWFVYQGANYDSVRCEVLRGGKALLVTDVSPWPVLAGITKGLPGSGIDVVSARGGAKVPTATYSVLVPTSSPLVFDLFAGGGFSIGRGLPDETQGKRLSAAFSVTKSGLPLDLVARGSIMVTHAVDSALATTTLADGLVLQSRDHARGFVRLGIGGRFFQASIRAQSADSKPIPEQVLAPAIEVSTESRFDSYFIGLRGLMVPLYVMGAGFHPSFNPSVEVGVVPVGGVAVVLGLRSDTIMYPTQTEETSLRMDTLYLSARRGF